MSETRTLTDCVQRAKNGDAASFDTLVIRHQAAALVYAYTLTKDWHLAEDVAQEAFLTAWRQIGTLQHNAAFSGWLRMLVFKHADRVRRARRATVPLEKAAHLASPSTDPIAQLLEGQHKDALNAAMLSLSDAERTAIILFYLDANTQMDIARQLGVSLSAVKKRMERGRARLRKEFVSMSLEDAVQDKDASLQAIRFTEVNRMLRDLTAQLEADPQVAAAYLARWGNDEGLGAQNDAWASLNLHVVIRDAYLDHFAAGRLSYTRRVREPLLWVEAPQNAPVRGYYLMTVYDGERGPYEVDWYWKPLSENATIPKETLLLLNKDGLPEGERISWQSPPPELPHALAALLEKKSEVEKHQESVRNTISLFWAMWLICARYIVRNPREESMNFVPMLRNLLRATRKELGDTTVWTEEKVEDESQSTLREKAALLDVLANQMEVLHPNALAAQVVVPVAIVPRARRFLADIVAMTNHQDS